LRKLLITPVYSNPDVDIDPDNRTKRLVSLGLCFTLSLVLIFGSINSLSFTPPNKALAADDMMGGGDSGGGDNNQGGDSGEDNNDDDSSNDMPKDAPQTTGALTAGRESDNDDDDDSGGNRGNDNDNDNEPTSKDAPVTTDTVTTKKKECSEGQEYTLFSGCIAAAENLGNDEPTPTPISTPTPTPIPTSTTCHVSYNPGESGQSSAWGMKDKQLMKINRGVFYYTADDEGLLQEKQPQLSLFHQVQGIQLGKTYDLSSYSGTECNINQVRNNDGSITATITYPNSVVKEVIRTDTTGKVPVQINYLDHNDKIFASEAIDDIGIATMINHDVGGGTGGSGLRGIEATEPGGTRPIISVVSDSKDGSIKILGRGELGQSSVGRHELQDDNDGDPTVATTKSGMKVTFTPFNEAYPNPGASNDDLLTTMFKDHSVFHVTNPDSSVKTHMIINPDGSVQPGPKWTAGAPVEPADPANE
jgi:hypothetical protein